MAAPVHAPRVDAGRRPYPAARGGAAAGVHSWPSGDRARVRVGASRCTTWTTT